MDYLRVSGISDTEISAVLREATERINQDKLFADGVHTTIMWLLKGGPSPTESGHWDDEGVEPVRESIMRVMKHSPAVDDATLETLDKLTEGRASRTVYAGEKQEWMETQGILRSDQLG